MRSSNAGTFRTAYIRHFLVTLAVIFAAMGATLFLLGKKDIQSQVHLIKSGESLRVALASRAMSSELDSLVTDLMVLANHVELRRYLSTRTPRARRDLEQEFLGIVTANKKFDQVRLIGSSGLELVRADRSPKPHIVPPEQLQDKSGRYYFEDSADLEQGQIYISALDLNMEHGQVQTPHKPMIRVATPVYDTQGDRGGIIILNYLASRMIDMAIPLSSESVGNFMLVNSEGYWLLSPNKEDQWGFMFEDRKGKVFASAHSEAWGDISTKPNGMVETEDGVFAFDTVSFPEDLGSLSDMEPGNRQWKLISFISRKALNDKIMNRVENYLATFIVVALLAGFAAAMWANSQRTKFEGNRLLRESEERFRGLVESSNDCIWETDPSGVYTYVSPHVQTMYGRSPEEMVGKSIVDFAPPATRDAKRAEQHAMYSARTPLESWRIDVVDAEGDTVNIETNASPVYDEDGAFEGYRGTDRDITSRIRVQAQLDEARAKAEAANHAKSDFLARMSHEIRTPMNAIIGMSHLALRTRLTERQKDYLGKIEASAHSLLGIINDILDFSKIESGSMTIEQAPFDLEQVMDNLASMLSVQAAESGLEFMLSISPEVPTRLMGDQLRLGQVLLNLAGNAIKFTERGEVMVAADPAPGDGENPRVRFSVTDTGIGMTREQIDNLFKPFAQADESITRRYGGTGLGLAICSRLVGLMGGELVCKSAPGQGTEFAFTLEFSVAQDEAPAKSRGLKDLEGTPVLVVDDNDTARGILRDTLEHMTLAVREASGCDEGLVALAEMQEDGAPAQVVFMDWKMPRTNGVECVRRIQRAVPQQKRPKIIMLTAYGREDIRREALEAGVDAFLLKPASNSVLYNSVIEVLSDGDPADGVEPATTAAPYPECLHGKRILIAEDNELNLQLAQELLEDAGAVTLAAKDGSEALYVARDNDFDAILMDIEMPVMDGLESARAIRGLEHHAKTPIIALTAHAMAQHRRQSMAAQMDDHLTKPIDPDLLYKTLERWITGNADCTTPSEPSEADAEAPRAEPDLPPLPDAPAGLDVRGGLQRFRYKHEAYTRSLRLFRNQFTGFREDMQRHLADANLDTARQLAHALKGAAGTVGAKAISAAAAELEVQFADKTVPPEADLEALYDALERLLPQLESFVLPSTDEASAPPAAGAEAGAPGTAPAVQRLLRLVEDNDIASRSALAEAVPTLEQAAPQALSRLRDQLDVLDFPGAAQTLRGIVDSPDLSADSSGGTP